MSANGMTAFASMRRREGSSVSGRSFLLVLFGVFALVMLLALFTGLQVYRGIADERSAIDAQRLAYGSLVNTVKAFDATDAFSVSEYEGNDVLEMLQRTTEGNYLMRLYVHSGKLMQQYSLPDAPIAPENAHALFETETFKVVYGNGMLALETDESSPHVRLACAQPSLVATSFEGGAAR